MIEDLSVFFSDFAVPIKWGSVEGSALVNLNDEAVLEELGRGSQVGELVSVLIRTDEFDGLAIGDAVTIDGKAYSVRERVRSQDGKVTRLLCRK